MKKKPIYAKVRPKSLGNPKSFNKKSKAYKASKKKLTRCSERKFLCIKTSSSHKLLRNINRERKSNERIYNNKNFK